MAWTVNQSSLAAAAFDNIYGSSTLGYTTTATVAANAWVFVGIISYFSDSVASAADNGPGLSWSVTKYTPTSDANMKIAILRAWAPAGMASGTTITATWTGGDSTSKGMIGSSFLGGDASSFDVAAAGASGNSLNWASTALNTAQNDELLFGVGRFANASSTDPTPVAGTVKLFYNHNTLGDALYTVYRIAGAAGSYNVAATFAGSADNWGALAIALKVAALSASSQLTADHGMGMGRW